MIPITEDSSNWITDKSITEKRDPRFAELDALIAAGLGDYPGGIKPDEPELTAEPEAPNPIPIRPPIRKKKKVEKLTEIERSWLRANRRTFAHMPKIVALAIFSVSEKYKIEPGMLLVPNRRHAPNLPKLPPHEFTLHSEARAEIVWRLRDRGFSYPRIGFYLNMHHTSVWKMDHMREAS